MNIKQAISSFTLRDISYSWLTLIEGYELNLILPNDLADYALSTIESASPDNREAPLAIAGYYGERTIDRESFEKDLKKLKNTIDFCHETQQREIEKWHYILLSKLLQETYTGFELHDAIIDLYYQLKTPEAMLPLTNLIPETNQSSTLVEEECLRDQQRRIKIYLALLEQKLIKEIL